MQRERKLWATQFPTSAGSMLRHESKAAVYRYIEGKVADWLCNALRSQHLTVFVDERDGRGWQTFEPIDLDELAKAGEH